MCAEQIVPDSQSQDNPTNERTTNLIAFARFINSRPDNPGVREQMWCMVHVTRLLRADEQRGEGGAS